MAAEGSETSEVVQRLIAAGVDVAEPVRRRLSELSRAGEQEAASHGLTREEYEQKLDEFVDRLASAVEDLSPETPGGRRGARPDGREQVGVPALQSNNLEQVLVKACKFWPFC